MPNITPEELALMVQRGFAHMDERFNETATKDDLLVIKEELTGLKGEVRRLSLTQDGLREDLTERLTTVADALGASASRLNRRVDDLQEQVNALKPVGVQ